MADPRNAQSASRLSEDIGDVLNAIRRMIAEDDALSTARERLIAERDALDSLVQEDAGEFLARRYGGNAALARRLAGVTESLADEVAPAAEQALPEERWPFGDRANAADVAQQAEAAQPAAPAQPQNDLARILSAGIRQPDLPEETAPAQAAVNAPNAPRGWRAWIAPEPRPSRWATPEAAEEPVEADDSFEALVAQNDFDEALDWKSRMRPDLDDLVPDRIGQSADIITSEQADEVIAVFEEQSEAQAPLSVPATPVFSTSFAGYQAFLSMSAMPLTGLASPNVADAGDWSLVAGSSAADVDLAATGQTAIVQEPAASDLPAEGSCDNEALLLSDAAIVSVPAAQQAPTASSTVTGLTPDDEEASIRDLLREMIQEELHGELGERFSRNIRAVIRREVAAAIDAHLERA